MMFRPAVNPPPSAGNEPRLVVLVWRGNCGGCCGKPTANPPPGTAADGAAKPELEGPGPKPAAGGSVCTGAPPPNWKPALLGPPKPAELGAPKPAELGAAKPLELGPAKPAELGGANPPPLGVLVAVGAV